MVSAKNPSRDPIQIFSANFPAHRDLARNPSKHLHDVVWPKIHNDDLQLRISRYTLEVLDFVASGKAKKEGLTNLIYAVLEFYGPSPAETICNTAKIASALIESGLYDNGHKDLEKEVSESISNWRDKAVEACKQQYPELAGFHGNTEYKLHDGIFRWGPTKFVAEYRLTSKRNG